MNECATASCDQQPAWPSVHGSLTWCQRCLADLARVRGYEPASELTEPKQRWLLTHLGCGRQRHSNLSTVRRTEPVCPHCRWTAWAGSVRSVVLPAGADTITRAVQAGDVAAALEFSAAFARHYDWSAERTREVFTSVDATLLTEPVDSDGLDPLGWSCGRCGWVDATPPERMLGQVSASWFVCHACNQQRLHHDPAPIARYFTTRGLDLLSTPAADREQAYDAQCRRCKARRRVSVSTLTSGAPPCLRCDGRHFDPDSPHRVYLFDFAHLQAVKVGITHCADDQRLRAHTIAGGQLLEVATVRDRAAAVLLERVVLDRFARWPAAVTAAHFPQGGWTECWDRLGGSPDLRALVAELSLAPR